MESTWSGKALTSLHTQRGLPQIEVVDYSFRIGTPHEYVFDAAPVWPGEAVAANVFISHACADTGLAEQVCRWLVEDGHRPFLDRDRDDGVLPGEEWEKRLYRELRNADAVVCVVTAAYLKSKLAFIGAVRPTRCDLGPLAAAQIPVLVMIGRDESVHDGPKMAARFRQRLPEARIEIVEDANHIIPVDQPQIVEKLLTDFLH